MVVDCGSGRRYWFWLGRGLYPREQFNVWLKPPEIRLKHTGWGDGRVWEGAIRCVNKNALPNHFAINRHRRNFAEAVDNAIEAGADIAERPVPRASNFQSSIKYPQAVLNNLLLQWLWRIQDHIKVSGSCAVFATAPEFAKAFEPRVLVSHFQRRNIPRRQVTCQHGIDSVIDRPPIAEAISYFVVRKP